MACCSSRDGEHREERRHDGRVAVDQRNTRWCSDGLEIACDNGEKVRVAFALDCCDREAMGHVATTGGITAEDVQDLMVATVEHRFGPVNRLPEPIEWLSDNGSCYVARDTRAFARDIGLIPRTTPVSSPQSNGMAEAFVRTLKRDYVRMNPRPDAQTVIEQLPQAGSPTTTRCIRIALWAIVHPASTSRKPARPCQAFRGNNTDRLAARGVPILFDDGHDASAVPLPSTQTHHAVTAQFRLHNASDHRATADQPKPRPILRQSAGRGRQTHGLADHPYVATSP